MKCFSCKKIGYYASQCPSKKKGKGKEKDEESSTEDEEEFATRFANEFSLVHHLLGAKVNGAWSEDVDACVVDSGASSHMTGMRSMFFSVSQTDSDWYVRCRACTMHIQ